MAASAALRALFFKFLKIGVREANTVCDVGDDNRDPVSSLVTRPSSLSFFFLLSSTAEVAIAPSPFQSISIKLSPVIC